ncbi:10835_t:CDS:2, partial [Rhizophagus irregularis]
QRSGSFLRYNNNKYLFNSILTGDSSKTDRTDVIYAGVDRPSIGILQIVISDPQKIYSVVR